MFPENVIQAAFQRVQTTYELKTNPKPLSLNDPDLVNSSGLAVPTSNKGITFRKKIESVRGMNILGFINLFYLNIKKLVFFYILIYIFILFVIIFFRYYCVLYSIWNCNFKVRRKS